jgi:hypothetical protein
MSLSKKDANEMIVRYAAVILIDAVERGHVHDVVHACKLLQTYNSLSETQKCELNRKLVICPPRPHGSTILQSILQLGMTNDFMYSLLENLEECHICYVLPIIESGMFFPGGLVDFYSPHIFATILLIAKTGAFALPKQFKITSWRSQACFSVACEFSCDRENLMENNYDSKAIIQETKRLMIGEEGFAMMVALFPLQFPALISLEILNYAAPLSIYLPIHYCYNFCCLVKHFHDKR